MRSVHSRGSRPRRSGSSLGRRRTARSRKSLSNAALWAVKIEPFMRRPSSSRVSSRWGAPRSMLRVMPWMFVGPTRCRGHLSLTSDDHWSKTVPSASTTTMPSWRIRCRRVFSPLVSRSTTANRGSTTDSTLDRGCPSRRGRSAGLLLQPRPHADRGGHGETRQVAILLGLAAPVAVLVVVSGV